jgi:poly(3-hydroxybutyrate) depolymerase
LYTGRLMVRNHPVLPSAIHRTGLMTIEAQNDDIAAPGQTYAAHALCCRIPDGLRRHLLLSGSGHFSLFHGNRWRSGVLPLLLQFFEDTETRRSLSARTRRRPRANHPPAVRRANCSGVSRLP